MPNPLTGDADVVIISSLGLLNRLLAAMHQNPDRADPHLLHSLSLSVDDRSGTAATGFWGTAQAQIGSPTITLPSGNSRLTLHYPLCTRLLAGTGSPSLPETMRGDLQASLDVNLLDSALGSYLDFDFSGSGLDVEFVSASHITDTQQSTVATLLHNILQQQLAPVNQPFSLPDITMPDGSIQPLHLQFKTMPGVAPAVALMLGLHGTPLPSTARDHLAASFLRPDSDFAIGVSLDYLQAALRQALAVAVAHGDIQTDFNVEADVLGNPVEGYDITLNFGSLRLEALGGGRLRLSIDGFARQTHWVIVRVPGDSGFTITQDLSLATAGDSLRLAADGDPRFLNISNPVIQAILSIASGLVMGQLRAARDAALVQATAQLQTIFASLRLDLIFNNQLHINASGLRYTAVDTPTGGLTLQGQLTVGASLPAYVHFDVIDHGDMVELNALNSWIPGGTIEQFHWQYNGVDEVGMPTYIGAIENGRFFRMETAELMQRGRWCLSLSGIEGVPAAGAAVSSSRPPNHCTGMIPNHGLRLTNDQSSIELLTALLVYYRRHPEPEPDWHHRVIGYLDPAAHKQRTASNTLVHFAYPDLQGVVAIGEALDVVQQKDSFVSVVIVTAHGGLEKLPPLNLGKGHALSWTDDPLGGWRKALDVANLPITYLLDDSGKVVWQQAGALDVKQLSGALNEHLILGGRISWQVPCLAVANGEPAPDFLFPYSASHQMSLHKLVGREVVLVFWASWSAPSLDELSRWQRETLVGKRIALAINDGEDPTRTAAIFKDAGFTLPLITDPQRVISRQYGINCWPTTVYVDEQGQIGAVQFGAATPSSSAAEESKRYDTAPMSITSSDLTISPSDTEQQTEGFAQAKLCQLGEGRFNQPDELSRLAVSCGSG